ncbi:MAG: pyridoxal phosphate-dependent aminotransferase, partial [Caulobacteraceae bacterium]
DGALERLRRLPLANLSDLARETAGDPNVIPLWYGEGDLTAPAFVGEAMTAAIGAGHVFYTRQNGVPELRAGLSRYLTALGETPVAEDRITVTQSGMNAIMLAIQLTCEAGDNVIVVDPVWPNLGGMARLVGAHVRSVRMDYGGDGWRLDPDKVAAAMDERTKVLFFASPGNPTGAMIPIETQVALLDLCRRRGVWLIADEVYNRLVFGAESGPSLLDRADPEDRLFVINSFSKAWAMTGWRLGWLVHPPSLGPTLAMMTQYTTSGATTFLQHAGVAALERGEPFVAFVREYCRRGIAVVRDGLRGAERVRLGPSPAAGMYVFFEVEGMTDSRAAALDILRATKVGLAPGFYFGPGNERFLRICACRSRVQLAEAMARLAPALA